MMWKVEPCAKPPKPNAEAELSKHLELEDITPQTAILWKVEPHAEPPKPK
jgi:hypothetical protein